MVTLLALIAYFSLVALERFGLKFNYRDLFVGLAALIVAVSLILGNTTGI